jgi:hypothetical protein
MGTVLHFRTIRLRSRGVGGVTSGQGISQLRATSGPTHASRGVQMLYSSDVRA